MTVNSKDCKPHAKTTIHVLVLLTDAQDIQSISEPVRIVYLYVDNAAECIRLLLRKIYIRRTKLQVTFVNKNLTILQLFSEFLRKLTDLSEQKSILQNSRNLSRTCQCPCEPSLTD